MMTTSALMLQIVVLKMVLYCIIKLKTDNIMRKIEIEWIIGMVFALFLLQVNIAKVNE